MLLSDEVAITSSPIEGARSSLRGWRSHPDPCDGRRDHAGHLGNGGGAKCNGFTPWRRDQQRPDRQLAGTRHRSGEHREAEKGQWLREGSEVAARAYFNVANRRRHLVDRRRGEGRCRCKNEIDRLEELQHLRAQPTPKAMRLDIL